MERKIRVLITKLGLDIHWRGAVTVAQFLREAGMEVIYLGNQFPEQIAQAALQEDVDLVGLSTLCGNHRVLAPKVVRLLRDKGLKGRQGLPGRDHPRTGHPLSIGTRH